MQLYLHKHNTLPLHYTNLPLQCDGGTTFGNVRPGARMFPMDPPPPPTENSNAVSDMKASLDGTVHRLYELIFKIAIPKSKAAKTTSIAINALLLACEMAKARVCMCTTAG